MSLIAIAAVLVLLWMILWACLAHAKRADDGSEELIRNLSAEERAPKARPLPERSYRMFEEDFDFDAAFAKHSAEWESEYEAGLR